MLAPLQRTLVFVAVLASLILIAVLVDRGHAGATATGALLAPVTLQALVLGAEFLMARAVNRRHGERVAGVSTTLRAWCGELASSITVFAWRQPFRYHRWADVPGDQSSQARGILLIHGYFCNRGLWNAWMSRLQGRHIPYAALTLEPAFGSIDAYVAQIENAVRDMEQTTGKAPVIVAHSMGGLAVRRWWTAHPPSRVHRLITLGTPHRGTWLARWGHTRNARQMRIGSAWLDELNRPETTNERAARCTCYFSTCDNIVFPASTATLAGADNRPLQAVGHVHMVDHPETFAEAIRWVRP